jgi:hypothetical protein
VKTVVATCGICGEPISVELPGADDFDMTRLQHEVHDAAEAHLHSHPAPEQARFWLRRFLDDVQPSERAIAVRGIYGQLRELWGDQDGRGVYSIDEVLGACAVYRLWLAANRCGYARCAHGNADLSDAPPAAWPGTEDEWLEIERAVVHHCTCQPGAPQPRCSAHDLLVHDTTLNRLLFAHRIAGRLEAEEFSTHPHTSADREEAATA